jgi:hypothetical protein
VVAITFANNNKQRSLKTIDRKIWRIGRKIFTKKPSIEELFAYLQTLELDKENLSTKQQKLLAHFVNTSSVSSQNIYNSRDGLYENTSYLRNLKLLRTQRSENDNRKLDYELTESGIVVVFYSYLFGFKNTLTTNFVSIWEKDTKWFEKIKTVARQKNITKTKNFSLFVINHILAKSIS